MSEKQVIENIALFDMDGTLCNYDKAMRKDYNRIKSPSDPEYDLLNKKNILPYLKERIRLVRRVPGWWKNLEKYNLGFDILNLAKELGFTINILTKCPQSAVNSWTEKVEWIRENLSEYDVNITISDDKGIVYGKVLVDDFPEYIERWLQNRPRGLVVMPANIQNKYFKHKNVIRYNGSNLEEVKTALIKSKDRDIKKKS